MADTGDNVSTAITIIRERDYGSGVADETIQEIKASVIFQYNWPQLLSSVPTAISSTGLAFLAASSKIASSVELRERQNGYKFLSNRSLDANLVQCGDIGAGAFRTAHSGMAYIRNVAVLMPEKIREILQIIASPPDARSLLKGAMKSLQSSADQCRQSAKDIDQGFEAWLNCATELHQVCVDTESSDQEQLNTTKINMAVAQTLYTNDKNTEKQAKETANMFKKQLKSASEAYKKASDNFPSGWDLVGQEIVSKLGDTLITAAGQALKAYTENMNPTARAEEGIKMFEDVTQKKPDSKTPPAPPKPLSTEPKASKDPAYVEVKPSLVYLDLLNALLFKGPGGGINWDEVADSDTNPTTSARYISQMLKSTLTSFGSKATDQEPSKQLLDILDASTNVVGEVQEKGSKGSLNELPKPDSPEVKKWQSTFQPKYELANQLAAVAKALPGATSRESVMAAPPRMDQTNDKSSVAQSYLQAAKDRLHTTQQAYLSTQKNYLEAREALTKQENELATAKANITKLTSEFNSLTQIKSVLINCITLIITVKQKVMDLVQFFDGISRTVDVIVEQAVGDFLTTLEDSVSDDPERQGLANLRVGPYILTDLQRTLLYKSGVLVEAYFSVFGDVAKMWNQLSEADIGLGLQLLDTISENFTSDDDNKKNSQKVLRDMQALTKWTNSASAHIRQIVDKTQKDVSSGMEGRVQAIVEQTHQLPAPKNVANAIDQGRQTVTEVASRAIKQNSNNSALSMFLPSS